MAEIETTPVGRTCLRRGVTDQAELQHRLRLLEHGRNAVYWQIHGRFTTPHARTKSARFYDKPLTQDKAISASSRSDLTPNTLLTFVQYIIDFCSKYWYAFFVE